jgi:hypothetical protein
VGFYAFSLMGSDAPSSNPLITKWNLTGIDPVGNHIEDVCGIISGKSQGFETGLSDGQIKTFTFSLGAPVLDPEKGVNLIDYLTGVLEAEKHDLFHAEASATLDLSNLTLLEFESVFEGIKSTRLNENPLFNAIGYGEQKYSWNDGEDVWELNINS